jgi:hypothetical protein
VAEVESALEQMALQHPPKLARIHTNMLATPDAARSDHRRYAAAFSSLRE